VRLRAALAVLAVLAATVAGGLVALFSWTQEDRLSVGRIRMSVSPFHAGALDLYVPLVDWGARFGGVRMPARLRVELRTIDRRSAAAIAGGSPFPVTSVRGEARDAIARYLRWLAGIAAAGALATGLLVALALRRRGPPRRRALVAVAVVGALAWAPAVAFLLAPRGRFDHAEYYAKGSDIPVALRALESASRSAGRLSEGLDSQLVGLARLVQSPGERPSLSGLPRFTVASDLHNNTLALPTLESAADGGPVLFPGDLTDSGSPLEASVTRRVVASGRPFVFTAGNHDSDTLMRGLARSGAIVLTQHGQLRPGHPAGPVVVKVRGVRIAGYTSPNVRLKAQGYRDRGADVTAREQAEFLGWLLPLVGKVDVVLVHEPALVVGALKLLRADPPDHPLLFAVGHTHRQDVDSSRDVTLVNGGTIGAGGTGNLTEGQDVGLAEVVYRPRPFAPRAVDLVRIDPGDGSAKAQRIPLDAGANDGR
jgi:predicted phosphodiesterase